MRSLIRFKRSDRRVQPFTGTLVVLLFICAQLSGILVSQHDANAQQKREFKKPMVREIFVPYAELETLLESQARRVYMTRKEYAELLKEAVKQAPNEPPHAASIVAADYQITLGDGRAQARHRRVEVGPSHSNSTDRRRGNPPSDLGRQRRRARASRQWSDIVH